MKKSIKKLFATLLATLMLALSVPAANLLNVGSVFSTKASAYDSVENSSEFGCVVTIDHGDGITAKYAAIKGVKFKAGDKVSAGDIIGNVTTVPCECADQSHLHLEVYKNGHAAPPLATLKLD